MRHIYTPLRYPGGKGKLAPFIKNIFRHNMLCDGIYIEPYAGGSAVALTLLLEGFAWNVIINDIDKRVYAFWWSILNETDGLLRMIYNSDVNIKIWEKQKLIHQDIENHSLLEIGFATFFLNRTNRSGILQAGVIGGKDQTGPYKINARYNKKELCNRIELIAQYKNRIQLYNNDAIKFIHTISETLPEKSLIYLDPPYFNKGKTLYKNSYNEDDHKLVAKAVRSIKTPWIVTYDNVREIRELYSEENQVEFNISYSANKERHRGSEIMFYSKNIILPSMPYTRRSDYNNFTYSTFNL